MHEGTIRMRMIVGEAKVGQKKRKGSKEDENDEL